MYHLWWSFFVPLAAIVIILIGSKEVTPQVTNENSEETSTYREILDPSRDLVLEWRVDPRSRTIAFQLDFQASDRYVALGLATREQLPPSDIVVVGSAYVLDMHSVDNSTSTILQDASQNWEFIDSSVTNTDNGLRTRVRIQRNLDTCDPQDLVIRGDLIYVIWDYGSDTGTQTMPPSELQPKGSKPIYFVDPMTLPISVNATQVRENASVWELRRQYHIPARRTSYWCSIHKFTPSLTKQHHIVGFEAYFENDIARRHVHHQLLYRCAVPSGMDPVTVFDQFTNQPGEECYLNTNPQLPSGYCRELVHIWAIGGVSILLPETMGIPIGDTANEYFMFEAHYDNPEERTDLQVVNGVDLLYSPQLRPNDGSIIFVGYGVFGAFVVPPNSSEFDVVGHCGSGCTSKMFSSPSNIAGVSLHAHAATRRMRLRHFRGLTELPWIQDDQDYHYDYQQIRFHPEPVTILPSDHLTLQCGYDNTDRNGTALASGYSTSDEMCMAFIFIDKRLPYLYCSSEYPTARTMDRFGINNMTWEIDRAERVVNSANVPNLVGLTLSEVVEAHTDWTPERRAEVENEQMFGGHVQNCINTQFIRDVLGVSPIPGLGLVQDVVVSITRPTLNTIQTPIPNPLPVTFPPVSVAYTPPTCPTEASLSTSSSSTPTSSPPTSSPPTSTQSSTQPDFVPPVSNPPAQSTTVSPVQVTTRNPVPASNPTAVPVAPLDFTNPTPTFPTFSRNPVNTMYGPRRPFSRPTLTPYQRPQWNRYSNRFGGFGSNGPVMPRYQ